MCRRRWFNANCHNTTIFQTHPPSYDNHRANGLNVWIGNWLPTGVDCTDISPLRWVRIVVFGVISRHSSTADDWKANILFSKQSLKGNQRQRWMENSSEWIVNSLLASVRSALLKCCYRRPTDTDFAVEWVSATELSVNCRRPAIDASSANRESADSLWLSLRPNIESNK